MSKPDFGEDIFEYAKRLESELAATKAALVDATDKWNNFGAQLSEKSMKLEAAESSLAEERRLREEAEKDKSASVWAELRAHDRRSEAEEKLKSSESLVGSLLAALAPFADISEIKGGTDRGADLKALTVFIMEFAGKDKSLSLVNEFATACINARTALSQAAEGVKHG